MKRQTSSAAFTLIELLVVISIIAILAGIALPVFSQVQEKGAQTKALSNAKQIALACKLYAGDYDGRFPSFVPNADGTPSATSVSDSNSAFKNLMPDYVNSENIFFVAKSAFTPVPPDENYSDLTERLKAGENHWAYVKNLTDTSNSQFPLIADGFADETTHTYTTDESVPGGVWKAKKAIVIRVDTSGSIVNVDRTDLDVKGPIGGTTKEDIFASADGWLGATQTVVNPLDPPGATP